jgi:drug/metabolite transporter (DMT)-like permease
MTGGLDRGAISYMIASSVLGLTGQVLLKRGASTGAPLLDVFLHPLVWGGLLLYAAGTFFWLLVLSRVKLSMAYPFTALNYVLVLVPSVLILGERVSVLRMVGVLVIAAGVALHATGARAERKAGTS